jgi:mRNA interferase RelE/StbE
MLKLERDSLPDFRVFQTSEFLRKLGKLPDGETEFLEKKLRDFVYPLLRAEPFYGQNIKKLRNFTPETWRYRVGKYRLVYIVNSEEKIVCMLTLDLRKEACRN